MPGKLPSSERGTAMVSGNLRLPAELDARFRAAALAQGINLTEGARRAVLEWVERQEAAGRQKG